MIIAGRALFRKRRNYKGEMSFGELHRCDDIKTLVYTTVAVGSKVKSNG